MRKVMVANLRKEKIAIKPLKEIVDRVLREEGIDGVEVSVVLADDEFIQGLNRTWRGVDGPTDVLAFPFREERGGGKEGERERREAPTCLGEIVISVDTARRQAKDLGHSRKRELEILLIHGTLHLLGYNHNKMNKRENLATDYHGWFTEVNKVVSI